MRAQNEEVWSSGATLAECVGLLDALTRSSGQADPQPVVGWGAGTQATAQLGYERLAMVETLAPARVRFFRRGVPVKGLCGDEAEARQLLGDAIALSQLEAEIGRGGTLHLIEVQRYLPDLASIAAQICAAWQERVWINLFASFGDTPGITPHWDDHDVFVLQLRGKRAWRLSRPTIRWPVQGCDDGDGHVGPECGLTLSSGDLLFVPWGWIHSTAPMSDQSLHAAFGVRRRTGLDLLRWLTGQLVESEVLRRPVGDTATSSELTTLRAAVAEALTEKLIRRFAEERREVRRDLRTDRLVGDLMRAVEERPAPFN